MQVDIVASPAFSFATVTIPPGGDLLVEAGAMASMTDGVEVETKARGGVLSGLKRSVLGGTTYKTTVGYFRSNQFWKFREVSAVWQLPNMVTHRIRAANGCATFWKKAKTKTPPATAANSTISVLATSRPAP